MKKLKHIKKHPLKLIDKLVTPIPKQDPKNS